MAKEKTILHHKGEEKLSPLRGSYPQVINTKQLVQSMLNGSGRGMNSHLLSIKIEQSEHKNRALSTVKEYLHK